ncbi:MAG TPA: hypothetical protein VFU88_21655 [Ktedonobacterales bacterium]|nr:hypothetical protein [Ktedonobacterales bacterium]
MRRTGCLMDVMDLGVLVTLLGGVCFLASLTSPYQATPLLPAGPYHALVLPPDHTWLSTWDIIRSWPGWWAPVVLAFLAAWITSGAAVTQHRPLLKWSGLFFVVALAGLVVGFIYAGVPLLFRTERFMGSGFWLSLFAMGCTGLGIVLVTWSVMRPTDPPSVRD